MLVCTAQARSHHSAKCSYTHWCIPIVDLTLTPLLLLLPPQAIFSHSREVDPVLVQKAVMAVLRLCTRLLPYKPDITASLVKGGCSDPWPLRHMIWDTDNQVPPACFDVAWVMAAPAVGVLMPCMALTAYNYGSGCVQV
jgi:hypothetical protein